MKIAIIGAGIAGLSLAHLLSPKHSVTLFESHTMAGGRITDYCLNGCYFDHGAQFFTAKSPQFKNFIQAYVERGLLQHWPARFVEIDKDTFNNAHTWETEYPHYVGCPTMSAWPQALAEGLNIHFGVTITEMNFDHQQWYLESAQGTWDDTFDWLVTTTPALTTKTLVPEGYAHLNDIKQRDMLPCYSLMLSLTDRISLPWDTALVRYRDISWISVNSTKPDRGDIMTLLAHSTNLWAREHYDLDDARVIQHLTDEVVSVAGFDTSLIEHIGCHRWQYANVKRHYGPRSYRDEKLKLATIGDWCIKGRVESAFLSAHDLSQYLNAIVPLET